LGSPLGTLVAESVQLNPTSDDDDESPLPTT